MPTMSRTEFALPQTHRCFLATIIFSIAICFDPSAFAMGFIFVTFYMGNKVLGYSGNCCKLLKTLLIAAWSLMLLFVAFFTVAMW